MRGAHSSGSEQRGFAMLVTMPSPMSLLVAKHVSTTVNGYYYLLYTHTYDLLLIQLDTITIFMNE